MADVVVNGARFNVQHLSDGDPTVVFLHGLVVDNSSSWYYTVANPVAQHAEVVIYDLRGHGLSERPPTGYKVEEQVEDLFGILDALGITRPVHLVGNSFGGVLAVAAAVHHPERVAGLTLIEAHIAVKGWHEQMVGTLEFAGLFLNQEEVHNWLDTSGGRKGKRLARNSDILLHQTSLVEDLAESPAFTQDDLNGITCPVLIICGEHSDVRDWAERLTAVLPSCELHLYEGCTHLIVLEAPTDVRDDLTAWFARMRAGELPPTPALTDAGVIYGDPAERETLYRPLALKEAAPRPPWYPADSPWPPQGGDLPEDWLEMMQEFARTDESGRVTAIPDHRDVVDEATAPTATDDG